MTSTRVKHMVLTGETATAHQGMGLNNSRNNLYQASFLPPHNIAYIPDALFLRIRGGIWRQVATEKSDVLGWFIYFHSKDRCNRWTKYSDLFVSKSEICVLRQKDMKGCIPRLE
jgi:hypothetical protein